MEKIEKSNKKLNDILSSRKSKIIIGTILFSGLGVALPRIFHMIGGSTASVIFLPMHIAVLIAALALGIKSGVIVAGSSVLLNHFSTGMPVLAKLPYMLIELIIYAILVNLFSKKYNSYIALLITMILGRVLYAGILFTSTSLLGFSNYGTSVFESFKMGIPGLVIQLACIPFIVKILKERLN